MFARLSLAFQCFVAQAWALRVPQHAFLANSSASSTVKTGIRSTGSLGSQASGRIGHQKDGSPPCKCENSSRAWPKPDRTKPECLFVDLGAGEGETYKVFLGQSSKWKFNFDTRNFKKSDCFAYLIEPNSQFTKSLEASRSDHVFPMTSMAAYMCDKPNVDFFIDVYSPSSWGSSLNGTHQSVRNTKDMKSQVQLYNLMRLLQENTIPEDTVVIKMDVEGAEWDILPCLASSPAAKLVDFLYLEDHCPGNHWCPTQGMAGNNRTTFVESKAKLETAGVKVMDYWSPM